MVYLVSWRMIIYVQVHTNNLRYYSYHKIWIQFAICLHLSQKTFRNCVRLKIMVVSWRYTNILLAVAPKAKHERIHQISHNIQTGMSIYVHTQQHSNWHARLDRQRYPLGPIQYSDKHFTSHNIQGNSSAQRSALIWSRDRTTSLTFTEEAEYITQIFKTIAKWQ